MLENETAHRLSRYLDAPIGHLRILASGWETTVFEFELESCSARFPELPPQRPLVLRFYQGILSDEKGSRESRVIERLYSVRYLVPRPYIYEPVHDALGAPFLIMEKIRGGPLFSTTSFARAFKTFSLGFFGFVKAQVKLHRINPRLHEVRDMPRSLQASATPPGTSLLDRALAVIAERVEKGPLPGLKDALRRLSARRGLSRVPAPPIFQRDYTPLNVMGEGVHATGVIDGVTPAAGHRHLAAAMTAAILSSSALEHPRWMRDNLIGNSLR